MATASATKTRKKTSMTEAHKAALAKGREEGRIVRNYLEAIESSKPRRGRKRTPESIAKRITAIDAKLEKADRVNFLLLTEERSQLAAELEGSSETVDLPALEKEFTKVAKSYGDRKGISYSSWRAVGVSASVLQQAKIPRSRG